MSDINKTYVFETVLVTTGSTSGGTSNDDYTIIATLSGNTLEFTRLSGGTYSVDLSSLAVTGSTSGGTSTDDYTVTAILSGNTLEFTRLSGGTYSVDLSSLAVTATTGPITFSAETSGTTTYVGYGTVNACKIRKIDTISGATYTAYWSEGVETLDKIWANRYTYSYF